MTMYVKEKTMQLHTEYWRYITRTGKTPSALKGNSNIWEIYLKWHEY